MSVCACVWVGVCACVCVCVCVCVQLVYVSEKERERKVMKDSNSKVGFLPTTQPLLIARTINWKLKTMTVAKLIFKIRFSLRTEK